MKDIPLFSNPVLWVALSAWALAQLIKVPLHYIQTRKWDWTLLLRAGGMPSSHSALVAATAHGIGLHLGYDTPLFAVAAILAVIVIYDATGIRRQAGKHAELINTIVQDLGSGKPHWQEAQEKLKEVLGHTPFEALAGTILGIITAQLAWWMRL
jgi:acid phosphatase family membrane protein YuiD